MYIKVKVSANNKKEVVEKTSEDSFNIAVKENFYEAEKKYRTALSKNKLNSKGAYNLSFHLIEYLGFA